VTSALRDRGKGTGTLQAAIMLADVPSSPSNPGDKRCEWTKGCKNVAQDVIVLHHRWRRVLAGRGPPEAKKRRA
jgi:hypothetical protein